MRHAIIAVSGSHPHLARQLQRALGPELTLGAYAVVPAAAGTLAKTNGVRRAGAIGSDGLVELLDAFTEGGATADTPVLVLHDDVALTDAALRALLDGAERLDAPVCAREMRAPLDAPCGPVLEVLVCGVASARQWRQRAESGGLHPMHQGSLAGWTQPAGAELRHPRECAASLARPRRSRVVGSMIVRDESALITGAVRSALALCDEVVVYDTGSIDDTRERAAAAGATVVAGHWPEDFAAARNAALDLVDARADWVLYLDADERLAGDIAALHRYLDQMQGEWPGLGLTVRNVAIGGYDEAGELCPGAELSRFVTPRLIDPARMHFDGTLHEVPVRRNGAPVSLPPLPVGELVHYGYDPSFLVTRDKHQRNLELARRQYAERGDAFSAVHLLRSLAATGTATVAEIDAVPVTLEALHPVELTTVRRIRAEALLREGRVDEAREVLVDALTHSENYSVAHLLAAIVTPTELLAAWQSRGPASAKTVQDPAHRGAVLAALLEVQLAEGQCDDALATVQAGVPAPVYELLTTAPNAAELVAAHAEHCPEPAFRVRARLASGLVAEAFEDALTSAATPGTEAGYFVAAAVDAEEVLVALLGSPHGGVLVERTAELLTPAELAHVAMIPLALGTGTPACVTLGLRAALSVGGKELGQLYRPHLGLLGAEGARLAQLLDG